MENLFILPLFAYKMASTLDSMIGYKSERYRDYGWFAARLDDVLNLVPSRLTALLMVCLIIAGCTLWAKPELVSRFELP